MKRGTCYVIPLRFNGIRLDDIERVKIIFAQRDHRVLFEYPSDRVRREGDMLYITFSQEETFGFKQGQCVVDTHITLLYADTNPQTIRKIIPIDDTTFKPEEVLT